MKFFSMAWLLAFLLLATGCEQPGEQADGSRSATVDDSTAAGVEDAAEGGPDRSADTQIVQRDIREMLTAVYEADADTVLSLTHPRVIDQLGGKELAKPTLEAAFAELKTMGLRIESLSFPEDPVFIETADNLYAIVPTRSVIVTDGQRLVSDNYQFGVRPKDLNAWKYVEGSRVSEETVRTMFPDFPANYKFPSVDRKKL